MEPTTPIEQHATTPHEAWHAPLARNTWVSRILAAVLLVVLPFLGFWLGVEYAVQQPAQVPTTPTPATTTSTTATSTDVATGTAAIPTTPDQIELDLSKLQGKDRLYTEEEGKYENLSEEERKLLEKIRCPWKSFTFSTSKNRIVAVTKTCDETHRGVAESFTLVSLKNNIAIAVESPDGMNSGWIHIYNIENDSRVETIMLQDYAFGPNYTVRKRPIYLLEGRGPYDPLYDALDFYRPGMQDFTPIPDSELPVALTYSVSREISETDRKDIKYTDNNLSLDFNGDVITAEVSRISCDETETGYPINCVKTYIETKTFNLSNLP